MKKIIKIGTRESQLATWQATQVKNLLRQNGFTSELVFIKSEGDTDTITPLYEIGVQGIFTKSLDAAILNQRIDIAVHSMKDVPTQLANGVRQAAVLERASFKDVFIFKGDRKAIEDELKFKNQKSKFIIATSSIRRKAQWLHQYPNHVIENIRGNVNTRLRKVSEQAWNGAIFAAAGLERINLRPENSIDLDWMLPAPAQGAIMIVCRSEDSFSFDACKLLDHDPTSVCTKIERDFLRALLGGCSTPISALAIAEGNTIVFKGNICSPDGKKKFEVKRTASMANRDELGVIAAAEILKDPQAQNIIQAIRNEKK